MAKRKGGLGRGLSALIPQAASEDKNESEKMIPVKPADSVQVKEKVSPQGDLTDLDGEHSPGLDIKTERPSDVFFTGSSSTTSQEISHERGGSVKDLLNPKRNVSRETSRAREDTSKDKAAKSLASKKSLINQTKASDESQITGNPKFNGESKPAAESKLTKESKRTGESRRGGESKPAKETVPSENTRTKNTDKSAKSSAKKTKRDASKSASNRTQKNQDELSPVPGVELLELEVGNIHPNRKQPRQVFDQDELDELAQSLKQVGLLQPVIVRRDPEEPGTFELVMGERRWRAAQLAELKHVPAIVREVDTDDLLRDALLENLHRVELNPLEEAAAYQQLMEDFGCTQVQLSQRIARSRSQIANTIRLLRLPAAVQSRVAAGVLSAGHARALLGLTDPEEQEYLADRIVAEGLSVRSTEEIVALGNVRGVRSTTSVSEQKNAVRKALPVEYQAAVETWTDYLDTKVTIKQGKKSSKLVIDFVDQADLDRITQALKHRIS